MKIQVFTYVIFTMSVVMPFVLSFLLLSYAAYANLDLVMIDIDLFYRLLERDTLKGFA